MTAPVPVIKPGDLVRLRPELVKVGAVTEYMGLFLVLRVEEDNNKLWLSIKEQNAPNSGYDLRKLYVLSTTTPHSGGGTPDNERIFFADHVEVVWSA